uniref:PAP-associated domain-containing protein n=1 Tax=Parastrongyloides trichosuri TaxID=131310 RepID=A0A0N4ZV75_PARTI
MNYTLQNDYYQTEDKAHSVVMSQMTVKNFFQHFEKNIIPLREESMDGNGDTTPQLLSDIESTTIVSASPTTHKVYDTTNETINSFPYEDYISNVTICYFEKTEINDENSYNFSLQSKNSYNNNNITYPDFRKRYNYYRDDHLFKNSDNIPYRNGNGWHHRSNRQYRRCTEEEINYIVEDCFKPLRKRKEFDVSILLENEMYLKNINWDSNLFHTNMDSLSEKIFFFHQSVMQSQSHLNRKLYLRDSIYYALHPLFSSANLYIIGSSLNGFGTNNSDMDLCLMLTGEELDQRRDAITILNAVKIKLSAQEWIKDLQLIVAKVPILRITFKSPFSNITVDLNANNSVTIKNTHLICAYSNFDWRVRPLVSAVKEWAKRKGINDANSSTFTSYSLVLMCIHYLQCGLNVPVLPSIQEMFKYHFNQDCNVPNLNIERYFEEIKKQFYPCESKIPLGELLIGFLKYYAESFDFSKDVISIRLGRKITREELYNNKESHPISQWGYVCIEEPFTLKNTAHSVYDPVVFEAIKKCFSESYKTLKNTSDFDLFLNGKSIKEDLGNYRLIPPGGVIYNTPRDIHLESKDRNKKL